MYLKEISTQGFKSFAEKITISLDGKITCIVGPNGSGKSNVVDAVRWVLGEQSVKSLRGTDNMVDVIFSGSKSRSALNVASVSLTFDNSDNYLDIPYKDVSIKRRIYRTGESEYFLNGEKCRLKDITDLLLDSATSKESFNIISQGEIGKILSNSPYERRAIFENAAGILKYKKRKEEAIKKLDKTNDNINRVNDIISEIETRVEPLRIQKEKAEEYLFAKDKLENIEVALITSEIEEVNTKYDKSLKRIDELNNEIISLNKKSSNNDITLIENKKKLLELEKEIKNYNSEILKLTEKENSLNTDKAILKERSKYSASDSKIHDNIASLKEDLYETTNSISLTVKDIELIDNSISSANSFVNKKSLEQNSLYKERENVSKEFDYKRREMLDTQSKIESLNNYIESNSSIPTSIRHILGNPRLKGVHGTVSSMLDCESMYLNALESAIASYKNYVIVDNEDNAKECISYLKDNDYGRATFYPISVIKPRGIDKDSFDAIKEMPGYVGILSDLLKYDSKYYGIVSNLFGGVIIANDIDAASKISFKIHRRYKVITLLGDVVAIGGSMQGGSAIKSVSVVTEKKNLERLNDKLIEIKDVCKSLNTDLESIDEKIKMIANSLLDERVNLAKLDANKKIKEELNSELSKRKSDIEKEILSLESVVDSSLSKEEERIMKEYYEVVLEKEKLLKEVKFKEEEKDKLKLDIEKSEDENRFDDLSIKGYEKELKALEIEKGKMEVKLDNYLKILSEDYSLTYEKAKDGYTLSIPKDEAREEVIKYRSIIKGLGSVNTSSIEEYKEVKTRFDFLTSEKNDLVSAKDTLFEIIDEMDEVMKKEFKESFEKIRVEFCKVFKQLFGGGSADLKLTDKDDLLNTGVDIVASPPGKTLKSVTLLSGGEMTLTAISLVFAMLNIKPVPFCIFDEVEAALDEANVDNFGRYLDNYKDKTQFLIITHKKKTMEYADCLYGITMQESGVSKLVSVKLSDFDLEKK